jgi:hypothetical protein
MITRVNDPWMISKSPHSISNARDLTTPGWNDSNVFLQRQKAFQSAGMGDLSDTLSSFFDFSTFNWQTVLLLAIGGYFIYKVFFSEEGKAKMGEKALSREYRRHMRKVKTVQKRYGVKYSPKLKETEEAA